MGGARRRGRGRGRRGLRESLQPRRTGGCLGRGREHRRKQRGGACAKPATGCACSSAGQQIACGQVDTNEGSFVTCSEGSRTCSGGKWGACVGTVKVIKSTGSVTMSGFHAYANSLRHGRRRQRAWPIRAIRRASRSRIDNSNGVDAGGLTPTDAGGWTLPLSLGDGGTCSGLQCSVPACSGGQTTTVTGTVLDPAGINPVYNAVVMIPNGGAAAVQPIPAGVSSDPCGGAPLPVATSFANSGTDGTFTLDRRSGRRVDPARHPDRPVAPHHDHQHEQPDLRALAERHPPPPTVGATCKVANNYAGNANCPTRLPRVQSEGNIPLTAIGHRQPIDAMECMLYRMGARLLDVHRRDARWSHPRLQRRRRPACVAQRESRRQLADGIHVPRRQRVPGGNAHRARRPTNITNPSFETASLTGWTLSGASVAWRTSRARRTAARTRR